MKLYQIYHNSFKNFKYGIESESIQVEAGGNKISKFLPYDILPHVS